MIIVVIATRNGAETLPGLLERLTQVTPPDGGWKLIVADNGSTDGSPEILRGYESCLPLSVVHESQRGKNCALNKALDRFGYAYAAAELVVFADDDIIPDRDWLVRLQEGARAVPDANIFGGTIAPAWPALVPPWLNEFRSQFGLLFALTSRGDGFCRAKEVWGPNMAVRGSVFEPGLRFDPAFGPDGSSDYPMGSETNFGRRLQERGHRAYFLSNARVCHVIRRKQLDLDALFQRAWRAGLGYALDGFSPRHRHTVAGLPVRLLAGYARARLLIVLARLALLPRWERKLRFGLAWHEGALAGAMRLRRKRLHEAGAPVAAKVEIAR